MDNQVFERQTVRDKIQTRLNINQLKYLKRGKID